MTYKRIKTILLAMVVLLMMTSVITAFGDETPAPTLPAEQPSKLPLTIEYMGKGNKPNDTGEKATSFTDSDVNSKFWIGIGTESVDSLKMSDLGMFTDGMYSLEVTFVYNTDYVVPYYANTALTDADKNNSWKTALEDGNLSANIGSGAGLNPSSAWWSNKYNIMTAMNVNIDSNLVSENLSLGSNTSAWKMCTVNVKLNESDLNALRFKDLSADAGKQYLLKLPFTFVSMPASPSAKVIKMVRGPESFNTGSGIDGTSSTGVWELSDSSYSGYSNLKNVFDFKGDISLFGTGDTISNLQAKPVEYSIDTDNNTVESWGEDLELVHDKDDPDTDVGFDTSVNTYYITVENAVDKIKLFVQSTDSVTIQGQAADVENISSIDYYTKEVPLNEIDPETLADDDGYNNIITVVSGDHTYTIKVKRMAKARVEFAPGNSPFGMIERMGAKWNDSPDAWTDTGENDYTDPSSPVINNQVEHAKKLFKETRDDTGNMTYGEGYVPDGTSNLETNYTTTAWNSYQPVPSPGMTPGPEVDYDEDPTALFVYTKDVYFVEPEVVIYDENGKKIDNSKIEKKIDVKILLPSANGVPTYGINQPEGFIETDDEQSLTEMKVNDTRDGGYGEFTGFLFTSTQTIEGNSMYMIRPDVYFIEYSYYDDDGIKHVLPQKRPVIILTERGDVSFTDIPQINTGDVSVFRAQWGSFEARNSLYAFRIADLARTDVPQINTGDVSDMRNNWGKGFKNFYNSSILK